MRTTQSRLFSQGGNLSCEFVQTESTCAVMFCPLKNNAYSFPAYQFDHGRLSYLSYQQRNKYTLFDGLAYNTCGYFASCVVFKSNEKNVRSHYMLNHLIRGLLFHYKKNRYFAIGFYFFGKSIQKHPDSIYENDVNNKTIHPPVFALL